MHTRIALALAASLLLATPALAAERAERPERGQNLSTPAPQIVPDSSPVPTFPTFSNHSSGAILSSAAASSDSGGNQGGTVETGDQTSTVTVVNIGPAANNTQVVNPPPQPGPATLCSSMRGCRSPR